MVQVAGCSSVPKSCELCQEVMAVGLVVWCCLTCACPACLCTCYHAANLLILQAPYGKCLQLLLIPQS